MNRRVSVLKDGDLESHRRNGFGERKIKALNNEMATKDVKDDTAAAAASTGKLLTRAEIMKHVSSNNIWIIIHNNVYNVTQFLNEVTGFSFLQKKKKRET